MHFILTVFPALSTKPIGSYSVGGLERWNHRVNGRNLRSQLDSHIER